MFLKLLHTCSQFSLCKDGARRETRRATSDCVAHYLSKYEFVLRFLSGSQHALQRCFVIKVNIPNTFTDIWLCDQCFNQSTVC